MAGPMEPMVLPGCPGGPPVEPGPPELCAEEDPPPWIICPVVEPPFENGKGPIPFEGMPKPASGEEPSSVSVEVEYDPTPPEGEGEGKLDDLPELELVDDYTYSDELTAQDEPKIYNDPQMEDYMYDVEETAEVDTDKGKRGGTMARRRSAPYRAMTGWCSSTFILERRAESS